MTSIPSEPATLCVRIHNNCGGFGYDYYDKSLRDLEENYVLWGCTVVHKSRVIEYLELPADTKLNRTTHELITNITAAELWNYQAIGFEDKPTAVFCRAAAGDEE
jgi:hypothetical protein